MQQHLVKTIYKTSELQDGQIVWQAQLDMDVLEAMFAPRQDKISAQRWIIDLPENQSVTLQTTYVGPAGQTGRVWHGVIPVQPTLQTTLVLSHGDMDYPGVAGLVQCGPYGYLISHASDGVIHLVRKEPRPWVCGSVTSALSEQPAAAESRISFDAVTDATDQEPAVITVLPVYGPSVKTEYKGDDKALQAMLLNAEAYINKAFTNSAIPAMTMYLPPEYVESFTEDDVHKALEIVGYHAAPASDNPAYKAIYDLRERTQADLVVLLTPSARNPLGGQANWIPEPASYGATSLDRACFAVSNHSPEVLAHELGHLLGGKHDRITMPWDNDLDPAYDYARGYIAKDRSFVTLMGYAGVIETSIHASEGEQTYVPWIQAFSAADQLWNGKPMGISLGQPDAADAATLFRKSTKIVGAYRGKQAEARRYADLQNLTFEVDPPLGGAVMPALYGPYVKGTMVSATAQSRIGYRFVKWVLDHQDQAEKNSVIHIRMDQPHVLRAQFEPTGEKCAVNVHVFSSDYDLNVDEYVDVDITGIATVKFEPEGPYLPGTHVSLQVVVHPDAGYHYNFKNFIIDGDRPGPFMNLSSKNTSMSLHLRVERDMEIMAYFTKAKGK